ARAQIAPVRDGAREAGGRIRRPPPPAGGHGRPLRAHPHVQLPAGARDRPPHRPDALPLKRRAGRRPRRDHHGADVGRTNGADGETAMKTELLCPTPEALSRAGELLRGGEVVGFPTETVYGLGANALDAAAVEKIFAAKGRPGDNPLIVHIRAAEEL